MADPCPLCGDHPADNVGTYGGVPVLVCENIPAEMPVWFLTVE